MDPRVATALKRGAWKVAMILALPHSAGAQAAATVPLLDPVYEDVSRLEALGLLGRAWTGELPYSVARIRRLAARARESLRTALAGADPRRETAQSVLRRIEARFAEPEQTPPIRGRAELELGGGRSPGRGIPSNGVGAVDAVVDPLWARRAGRAYGDRATLAVAGGASLGIGRRSAVGLGGRASALRGSGVLPGRRDGTVETAYVRTVFGAWAVQVGRDHLAWGWEGDGLLLSGNGPTLDMIRLATDQPVDMGFLGDGEVTVLAADLGPHQNFPHAKLFAGRLALRPSPGIQLGLSVLNKQMGEGAPDASVGARIRDLTVLWGLFKGDDIDRFSDKLAGADLRVRFGRGLIVEGAMIVTDFDKDRVGDVLDVAAAYRAALILPNLGPAGRHRISVGFQRIGPQVYRHTQFRTGLAVDGYLQGSTLGPDARRLEVGYLLGPLAWLESLEVLLTTESMSADPHAVRFTPERDVYRVADLTDERRTRGVLRLRRSLWGYRGGARLTLGVERVGAFSFVDGADRTDGVVSLVLWRTF